MGTAGESRAKVTLSGYRHTCDVVLARIIITPNRPLIRDGPGSNLLRNWYQKTICIVVQVTGLSTVLA